MTELRFVNAEEAAKWPVGTPFLAATNRQYGPDYHVSKVRDSGLLEGDLEYPTFLRLPDVVPGVPVPPKQTFAEWRAAMQASGYTTYWDTVDDVDRELRRIRGCETYAEQFEDMTREELLAIKADLDAAIARLPESLPEVERDG